MRLVYFFVLADHETVTGSSLRAAYSGPACRSLVPASCGGRGWIHPHSSGCEMLEAVGTGWLLKMTGGLIG